MPASDDARLPKGDADQFQKFVDAARKHGADPSVRRWDERMKKVAKAKPEPSK